MALTGWLLFRVVAFLALCPPVAAFPAFQYSNNNVVIRGGQWLSLKAALKPNFSSDDGRIEKFQVSSSRGSKAKLIKKNSNTGTAMDGWS